MIQPEQVVLTTKLLSSSGLKDTKSGSREILSAKSVKPEFLWELREKPEDVYLYDCDSGCEAGREAQERLLQPSVS